MLPPPGGTMKTIFLIFVSVLNFAHAETLSVLAPRILEAVKVRKDYPELKSSQVLRDDLVLILNLFDKHQLRSHTFDRWEKLKPDDFKMISLGDNGKLKQEGNYPPLALHAHKFLVAEESDDVTNDDIYVSFFITDGHIPTAKVSSIYRGLDEGESFLFNLEDRILYPLSGGLRIPRGHLIVDYMIIESDGDDISEMKRISGFITDLAIEFYKRKYGDDSGLSQLREEVRALSEALLDLDHDDRLVTASWAPTALEVQHLLEQMSYADVTHTHKESSPWGDFKYKMTFRIIR